MALLFDSQIAAFDGSQDFVDVTWDETFTNFRLTSALAPSDGSLPSMIITNVTGAGLRVEPTARFTGNVYLSIIEVP